MHKNILPLLLHEYREGIKNPTLKTFKTTLQKGIEILRIASVENEGLPVLKDIFSNHENFKINYESFKHLCLKLELYFCTNIDFKYYRYVKSDANYKESFDLDFSKHDIRSLLILITCNYINQNSISKATRELIDAYEYIDQVKHKTSLEAIKRNVKGIDHKHIENRYKKKEPFSRRSELSKIIKANLYLLSYDHEGFTYSKKDTRIFNAFTSLNRIYRENELAFQLAEYDIKSANPQIIDKIFGFDNWKNVYSNLMQAYSISRSEAKIKFNKTLNNHRLSNAEAEEIYLNSGYTPGEANRLAKFTTNCQKGHVYREMVKHESHFINKFIESNFKDKPCIRLHDAVYFEPEFYSIKNINEIGIDFGFDILKKQLLTLDLKIDTFKTTLTTPKTSKFIVKQDFGNKGELRYNSDHFNFYENNFLQLNATFNISKPIINRVHIGYKNNDKGNRVKEYDTIYRTPTHHEFIDRLQKLFKILYYLNESFEPFFICVEHIHDQPGISFNKNYVYQLAENWTFDVDDGLEYLKNRNWTFKGDAIGFKEFNKVYHESRKAYIKKISRERLKSELHNLYVSLSKEGTLYHIDKGMYHKAYDNECGALINKVNDLIGIKKIDAYNRFNEVVQKIDTLYIKNYIGCKKTAPPSERQISKHLNISRRFAKQVKYIYDNKALILSKIKNAIKNLDDLQDVNKLFDKIERFEAEEEPTLPKVEPSQAFDYPINYEYSIFNNMTYREAMSRGKEFFVEYVRHSEIKKLFSGARRKTTNIFDNEIKKLNVEARRQYDIYKPKQKMHFRAS